MTRRFEFVGGNSAKFWEVTHAGMEVTISFGRIGTIGQLNEEVMERVVDAIKHVLSEMNVKDMTPRQE